MIMPLVIRGCAKLNKIRVAILSDQAFRLSSVISGVGQVVAVFV